MLDNFESSSSQCFLEYTWYTGFGPMIVDCDALSEVLVSLNKKLLDAMQKFILLALTLSFIEKNIQGGISHSLWS